MKGKGEVVEGDGEGVRKRGEGRGRRGGGGEAKRGLGRGRRGRERERGEGGRASGGGGGGGGRGGKKNKIAKAFGKPSPRFTSFQIRGTDGNSFYDNIIINLRLIFSSSVTLTGEKLYML